MLHLRLDASPISRIFRQVFPDFYTYSRSRKLDEVIEIFIPIIAFRKNKSPSSKLHLRCKLDRTIKSTDGGEHRGRISIARFTSDLTRHVKNPNSKMSTVELTHTYIDSQFLKTRSVLFTVRITSVVSFSVALTSAFLIPSLIGASLVAMNLVPAFMPSQPIASHQASCDPVTQLPLQIKGILSLRFAMGNKTKLVTSIEPGWPPHSKPSMLIMSAPSSCAFNQCLMVVHLWITTMPCSLNFLIHLPGLLPHVSMIGIFSSIQTSVILSKSGPSGFSMGRKVKFTQSGLLVSAFHFLISHLNQSALGCVKAVTVPTPPASETAAAISQYPTCWSKLNSKVPLNLRVLDGHQNDL